MQKTERESSPFKLTQKTNTQIGGNMLPAWTRIRYITNSYILRIFSALKPFSTSSAHVPSQVKAGFIDSIKYKVGIGVKYSSGRLKLSGENIYIICAEYPEFKDFVENLDLPDTFQTWFSLTTLHIWMCLVRLRREGQEGRILKNTFIQVCEKQISFFFV